MLYKVRDFVNANILKSIYYALFESHINYACIIWGQNISTINHLYILKKRDLKLSITKSIMLTPLLCFITLKLLKLQTKSRLRTVCIQTNIPIINYLQFLLIGLHFYQCLTIIKHCFPLKEVFKSLASKQHHMEKMVLFIVL